MYAKLLVLAALAVGASASARVFAIADTEDGGQISVTNESSPKCVAEAKLIYVISPQGEREDGCWRLIGPHTAIVQWEKGEVSLYQIQSFRKPTAVQGGV